MKSYTMVMRCGDSAAKPESLSYVLIGEDFSIETITGVDLASRIKRKDIVVHNMDLTDKGLNSTNGALKNYTLVDSSGRIISEPRAVILNRVESPKGLVGYTIYNTSGVLQEVKVGKAAELAAAGKIANGKIRHTQQGDIVASINGFYPLRTIQPKEVTDTVFDTDIVFIGKAIKDESSIEYAGIMLNAKNAATITAVYNMIVADNASVIGSVSRMSGKDEAETLGIKRTGSAGFYGVFTLSTILKIVSNSGGKVRLIKDKVMVACTDYASPDADESDVIIDKQFNVSLKRQGTPKSDEAIKAFANTVIRELKRIELSK